MSAHDTHLSALISDHRQLEYTREIHSENHREGAEIHGPKMAFEPKMAASKAAIPSIGTDTIRQPEKAPGPYDCTGAGGGEEEGA